MKIVIAGGSGFLGQVLAAHFQSSGHSVTVLTRSPTPGAIGRTVLWDAESVGEWTREIDGADVVINLTGRTVNCRYNAQNRREILESRVNSTRIIGEAIARAKTPARVWLNASTATIYKHTLGEAHDETGEIAATPEAHDAFSIEVAKAWERALDEANTPRTRKVALRAAMVLGHGENSVFPTLRRMTRIGLGGRLGNGRQWVSWIHQSDFCGAIDWIIAHEDLCGPINLAAPCPVTNAEMMRALRAAVGVPIGLPSPAWALPIGAFIMRTEVELIIKSRRVVPARLLKSGFRFKFDKIADAFKALEADRSIAK